MASIKPQPGLFDYRRILLVRAIRNTLRLLPPPAQWLCDSASRAMQTLNTLSPALTPFFSVSWPLAVLVGLSSTSSHTVRCCLNRPPCCYRRLLLPFLAIVCAGHNHTPHIQIRPEGLSFTTILQILSKLPGGRLGCSFYSVHPISPPPMALR